MYKIVAEDAKWEEWSDWSACSVTCMVGWQKRSRKCIRVLSQQERSEDECGGAGADMRSCPTPPECPSK